jgi:hypothetical protein
MLSYHVTYRWDTVSGVPVLFVTLAGQLLADASTLADIIDQTHRYVDACDKYNAVHIIYDFTRTERRLPLHGLMQSGQVSRKVRGATVVGAQTRKDEMAVLIMAAAKQVPYDFAFTQTLDEALITLAAQQNPRRFSRYNM